jgi:hypothetical protein
MTDVILNLRGRFGRSNIMSSLFMIWIALLLLVTFGTFISTSLYISNRKGNQGNRPNAFNRTPLQP